MNVEIVTIGDELLLGLVADTNSPFLARELSALGVAVQRRTACGDERSAIERSVGEALDRVGAVIVTGGLGSTADDVTKPAVANLFGRAMVRDEGVARHLEHLWRSHGHGGSEPEGSFALQCMVPEGCEILPNSVGSAPGIFLEDPTGRWVALLPGVPGEMRAMFHDALLPRIKSRSEFSARADAPVIRSLTLRTTGIPESALADQLGDLAAGVNGLPLAFLPDTFGVKLRLTSRGLSADAADAALASGAAQLRARVGAAVYGEDDTDLAAVVLNLCRSRAMRISVAESCTGGLLGARITAVPGSSDIFHGGIISYDNRVKRQLLGVRDDDLVRYGAVSEPVARQMAKGARVRLGTEIGIGITGVAGPGGGTPGKPVGTVWIALDVAEGRPPLPRPDGHPPITPYSQARVFQLVGNRDEIRQRAAQAALDMLRRTVAELPNLSAI